MEEFNKDESLTQSGDSIEKQGLLDPNFLLEEEQIREIVISNDKIADITMLLYIGSGLVVLLFVLLFFFFFPIKKKVVKKGYTGVYEKREFETLLDMIKSKETNTKDLKKALDSIIRDYGKIDKFYIYLDILYRIPIHPNADKGIINDFEKKLSELNPQLKDKISKAVAGALNGRAKHLPL